MTGIRPADTPIHIPLLVAIGRSRAKIKGTVKEVLGVMNRWGFDPQHFSREFGVDQADWVLHQEEVLNDSPIAWTTLCQKFLERVQHLWKLDGNKTLHTFLDCPAALAIGLGASLGTRYASLVYHWQPPYKPVLELDIPAQLKSKPTSSYEYITVHQPERWTQDVVVALQLSAYSPEVYLKSQVVEQNIAFVAIRNTYDNFLPADANWIQAVQEVVSSLRIVLSQPDVQRLHLIFSCPVPMAFAIGIGLGIQAPIRVYNWFADQQTYVPVMDLDQLRSLGAGPAPDLYAPWQAQTSSQEQLSRLRQALINSFDESELKTLCFELGIDYGVLSGEGKADKARELVLYLARRDRIPELVELGRSLRPSITWN